MVERRAQRFVGVFFALGIGLTIWLMSLGGWLDLPRGTVYDAFVRLTPAHGTPNESLLLVECTSAQARAGDEVWLKALRELRDGGAQNIGITFMPSSVSPELYAFAALEHRVVFGRSMSMSEQPRLEPVPVVASSIPLSWAVYPHPPPSNGVYRSQFAWVGLEDRKIPSLVLELAQRALEQELDPHNPFMLNFVNRPQVLPSVSLDDVIGSNVTPEMIQGRTVLVGLSHDPGMPGLITPLQGEEGPMSLLRYNGYALENLLASKVLQPLGKAGDLACILAGMLLLLVICQLAPLSVSLWVSLSTILLSVFLSWSLVFFFQILLPAVEMVLAQSATFVLVYISRSRTEVRMVRDMVLAKPLGIYQALLPESLLDSEEYWMRITTMVNQTLNLKRTIFLETVAGDHRVREIASLNCSIDDIGERRRDFQRTPYTTALESGGPYRLPAPFLTHEGDGALEYLVPLRFAGQILGFWALELDPDHVREDPDLLVVISGFAGEIGELLFRRNQQRRSRHHQEGRLRQLFSLESGLDTMNRIYQGISSLEKRVLIMESVFQTLGTATILYDFFGRVIQINTRMSEMLQQAGLAPYDLSALDLAVRLTGESAETIRSMLAEVIRTRRPRSMTITLEGGVEASTMILTIKALARNRDDREDESHPFELYGLLFELVDISEIREQREIKERLVAEGNRYLKQGVETLSDACTLMDEKAQDPSDSSRKLQAHKQGLLDLLDRLSSYMGEDMHRLQPGSFPIDPDKPLHKAAGSLGDEIAAKKLTLDLGKSESVLVLAEQRTLQSLFEDILTILIQDAVTGGTITTSSSPVDTGLELEFSNTGFGMPDKEFQALLTGKGGASESFKRIRQDMDRVRSWKGELSGTSELGRGTTFSLRLQTFLQDNPVAES
jgi:CHASE2 domain-containing sensor protein/signal transduction histidine kinase